MLLILLIVGCGISSPARNRSFPVGKDVNLLDGTQPPFSGVIPGDTLLLEAGKRDFLLIRNFSGTPEKPVVFVNSGGVVTVETNHYYGISIQHCTHFRLSGAGVPGMIYGIRIVSVANGTGIGIGGLSSGIEVDHISVEYSPIAGIYVKTDPDCTFAATRDKFTQSGTFIHDNYIANAGNEGIYVGSTFYTGQMINCSGKDTLLLPPLLENVKIYNNVIENAGWDGIQVSSASKLCEIHHNTILKDSQGNQPGQMSGILLGGGSVCECYNNLIRNGNGIGIESHGLGGNRIYNNIIVNAGLNYFPDDPARMKHGIYLSDQSTIPGRSYQVLFNTIISPKSDGIRLQSSLSRNNLIAGNLIIAPGNQIYYEVTHAQSSGTDAFIMLVNPAGNTSTTHNHFFSDFSDALISGDDYIPYPCSPVIDAGPGVFDRISSDFYGNPRLTGLSSDAGAVEFDPASDPTAEFPCHEGPIICYPNPVKDELKIFFTRETPEERKIDLYNLYGKKVFRITVPFNSPSVTMIKISLGFLPEGIYLVHYSTSGEQATRKIIKVR